MIKYEPTEELYPTINLDSELFISVPVPALMAKVEE